MGEADEEDVVTDLDELAEPYAQLVDEGRFRLREDPPGEVHAWLLAELDAIRDREYRSGVRYVDRDQAWLALVMVSWAAISDDQPWLKLTNWRHGDYDDSQDMDEVAIQRAVDGHRVRLNSAETQEAVRRLGAGEFEREEIAARLRLTMHQVGRYLANFRPPEQVERHEREVQRLVAEGVSVRDIARRLGISPRAVTYHKQRLAAVEGKAS